MQYLLLHKELIYVHCYALCGIATLVAYVVIETVHWLYIRSYRRKENFSHGGEEAI